MLVYIINKDGKPLMPCRPQKARKLLKAGKAVIVKYQPFTLKLKFGSSGYKQPVTLGLDAGSVHIGASASTKKQELYRKALMTHLEWNHQVNMNAVNHALKIRVEQTNAKTAAQAFQKGRTPAQTEGIEKDAMPKDPEQAPGIPQPESVRTAEKREPVRAPDKQTETKETRKEQGKRHYLKTCRKSHGRERGSRSR